MSIQPGNRILDPFHAFGDPSTFGTRMRNNYNPDTANVYLKRYLNTVLFETLNQILKESIHTDRWFIVYTASNVDEFVQELHRYNIGVIEIIGNFGVVIKLPNKQTTTTASL